MRLRILAGLCLGGCLWAQQAGIPTLADTLNFTRSGAGVSGHAEYRTPPLGRPAVTSAPFSGIEITRRQTRQRGGRLESAATDDPRLRLFRDASGRTRTERPLIQAAAPAAPEQIPEGPMLVELNDPVAGIFIVLNSDKKTAHRVRYAPARPGGLPGGITVTGQLIAPPTNMPTPPKPEVKEESLGAQTISGMQVTGRRVTTTYPPYTAGNERAFSTVQELWRSPVLQLVLRSTLVDSRGPETTFELRNLSTSAPDARLFEIPAGYRVINEMIPFRVEFGTSPAKR